MTDHPITPPSELAAAWVAEIYGDPAIPLHPITLQLVARAAQWGYDQRGEVNEAELLQARDQELEACLAEVSFLGGQALADRVRAARRPKPPSLDKEVLKKEACDALDAYIYGNPDHNDKQNTYNTIRRALEALSND